MHICGPANETTDFKGPQMTRISVKNNCKGVVKYFNKTRASGLIVMDDGSEHHICRRREGDGDCFEKGRKVTFTLRLGDQGAQIVDLRPL